MVECAGEKKQSSWRMEYRTIPFLSLPKTTEMAVRDNGIKLSTTFSVNNLIGCFVATVV